MIQLSMSVMVNIITHITPFTLDLLMFDLDIIFHSFAALEFSLNLDGESGVQTVHKLPIGGLE